MVTYCEYLWFSPTWTYFLCIREVWCPVSLDILHKSILFWNLQWIFFILCPSSWHQHFRGIFGGCTLSIILFLAGTNVIIEYAILSKAPCFIYSGNVSPPLVRAFMDDMSLCHLLQQSLKIYSHTLYNTTNLGKHVLQGT